jgi:MFS superfamily sulfate permease-like transporter/mannitol/fructose-specific phosphotransferase system IIA component (Ntr-type)
MSLERAAAEDTSDARSPWLANLGPAVVVTLISIPLSMGIAIASGAPAASGLVTAIVGGLVIGALSGSPLQISGPSAGLAVMVLELINQHGIAALAVVVPLMGLIQASAGLLKLGQIFRAVSPAVINGMLAGIGVLIFAAQFHVMVDGAPKGSGLENLLSIPEAVMTGIFPLSGSVHNQAAAIGLLTLAVLAVMAWLPKGSKLSKIPPALAAVIIATIAAMAFGLSIRRVDMPASFMAALSPPTGDHLGMLRNPALIISAVALAFVASAETLLCSSAVDGMHNGERTDYNRELFAQGVGNVVCGLAGALPTTGVITRSTANVEAGASGRQSPIMVGACLLAFMVAFPTLLEVIPRACLAAILVFIGFKLVKKRPYAELRRYGWSEMLIYVATIAVIVSVNLLTGIVVGFALALVKLLVSIGRGFHRLDIRVVHDSSHGQVHVHLKGAASFIRLPKLAATLEALPPDDEIHLHVEDLDYIDHACLDLVTKWERQRIQAGLPVRVEWDYLHHKYHAKNPLDKTPDEHSETPEHPHHLLDFIQPELVFFDEPYESRMHAVETLGLHVIRHYDMETDGDALLDSAVRREEKSSTCVGGGLMIPHGYMQGHHELLGGIAISSTGWDFGAPDGEPVRCIVFLATPQDSAAHHLAVLAAFARLFARKPELRDEFLSAKTPQEIVDLLLSPRAAEINYAFDRLSTSKAQLRISGRHNAVRDS